ncbi:dynactin-like protein Arp1 p62 subunit RO2 [Lentithecium fluviatile CBS 122367]|uniref:Dynactin subunit 4 n=1 Tax=Lentithecium fluviatile CBS 122367 TaxID=1168545 RepID=A0A6G1J6G0_9PLEO|nr:dynactin-like protein Arp1 p62 subunit RO2 [Lentithecium fluviatile CBS 122367]
MAQPFPYTYYACDCFDSTTTTASKRASQVLAAAAEEDERDFDPRSPRSNYSLFPLEHLLYCEDCQQIRCPRCVIEETLNWYCPSCLFEVPSSVVKSDGNRCTRNCFNCPVCTAPMTTNSLDTSGDNGPPYILACPYCHWSTVEIGIEFEKSTGISSQLARVANGGKHIPTQKERDKERERKKELEERRREGRAVMSPSEESPTTDTEREEVAPSHDELFANLGAFYKSQMEAQTPSNPFSSHDINYSSPSAYSRIVNLYSSTTSKKNKRNKHTPFREAGSALEGLTIHDSAADAAAIERIKREGWGSTLSPSTKHAQINPNLRFDNELRPLATLLCTKRSKRCRSCRHILSKPETKVTSTRYKIKLLALNHIPRLSIRALPLNINPAQQQPLAPPARPESAFNYNGLKSGIPTHFLLHLSNPLFDPIRVTLATPSTTPGKVQSRITILCPQFDVGANTDVWDDALASTLSPINRTSLINDAGQIEAGKIWDRGRNWTSVVVEVVPGFLKPVAFPVLAEDGKGGGEAEGDDGGLDEDEDVLEIPVFVRIEFEADVVAEERGLGVSVGGGDAKKGEGGAREKREVAFWTVVGAGRIAPL